MTQTTSVFLGSIRPGREGEKVANWITATLKQRGHRVHLIDPLKHQELLTMHTLNHYNPDPSKEMEKLHNWLLESDGFILVTPEYNHSFSGAIKNALDNFMPEYEKKPFGIVSYSIGPFGGIRANEALRVIVSELKGVPTPIPFMISSVQNLFDEKGELKDMTYNDRIKEFLEDYEWYLLSLKEARQKMNKSS
ncbi:MAG: NADPH-dependent FMN reductase [Candidatus Nanoarchaeia archaeon]